MIEYTHYYNIAYTCSDTSMYIQSKLDNSTLTERSFHVELASMLSYRMYKLMT